MRCVCLAFGSRHRGRRGANSEAAHGSETFRADASARARPATFNKYNDMGVTTRGRLSRRFTQSRIHLAARQAALRSIQVLLVRGASATVLDGQGWSCLHHLATSSADDESKALAHLTLAALRAGRPTPMRRHLRVAANTQV